MDQFDYFNLPDQMQYHPNLGNESKLQQRTSQIAMVALGNNKSSCKISWEVSFSNQ